MSLVCCQRGLRNIFLKETKSIRVFSGVGVEQRYESLFPGQGLWTLLLHSFCSISFLLLITVRQIQYKLLQELCGHVTEPKRGQEGLC